MSHRASIKYDKYNRLALFGERVPGVDKPVRQVETDKDGKPKKDAHGDLIYKKDKQGNYIYGPANDDGTDNITTKYKYDHDDRITDILFNEKAEERSVKYTYDGLGRIKTKIICNGGEAIVIDEYEQAEDDAEYQGKLNAISYAYLNGKDANATTPLVEKITHGAINTELNYEYDTVGNIIKETTDLQGNMNQYEYDKLGQLIRANERNDNTAKQSGVPGTENAVGTTWVYEYDLGGNILSKKAYLRTTGEVSGTPIKTVNYTYGDPNWADQMTAYGEVGNMKPITYDEIGNPTQYDDWTYTWAGGRKLMRMELQSGQKTLEFKYNASGLRTQKKVTESDAKTTTTTTTDYFLHGKLLTHLVQTKDTGKGELHFYYDAQSKPIMMRVITADASGKMMEETAEYYVFVTNLQGDILGILDKNQDLVVQYRYDPWGKLLETICEPQYTALAKMNPFRYRGYAYDEETQLYYLRSRYYNPEWGRFINADSLIGETGKLLAHNIFAYCENSPVKMIDPDGTNGFTDFMGEVGQAFKNEWNAFYGRSAAVWNNPSAYTIGDMVTFGLVSQTDRAWHPKEPFSAEHWSDSFWVAARWTSYGVSAYGMAGGTSLLNPGTPNLANAPTYGYRANYGEAFTSAHTPQDLADEIGRWLGEVKEPVIKPSGDFTILSKDGTRLFMSHMNHPAPHLSSHVHRDALTNGGWLRNRIYPADIPHQ